MWYLLSTTYRHGDEYLYVGVKHDRESYIVIFMISLYYSCLGEDFYLLCKVVRKIVTYEY